VSEAAADGEGPAVDREAMDRLEQRFYGDIWDATPASVAAEHGVAVRRFGPIQATALRDAPEARFLNLVLGAAGPDAVEQGHLADAVAWMNGLGIDYYVPVTPGLPGVGAAEQWLRDAGFEQGYAWMKFIRDASPPKMDEPAGVDVSLLAEGEGAHFGQIAAEGFGLPAWTGSMFGGLPGRPGWRCYLARVDGEPAACAGLAIDGEVAELGIAATREPARGRGCQQALLRRRIADAAQAGCSALFVETGERVEGRPSGSYRNILRAGFAEGYLRPNWTRPARTA
jgi:GNAT superfamily N-acetyltransferase